MRWRPNSFVASILAFRFIATISPFCHPLSTVQPSPYIKPIAFDVRVYENVLASPGKRRGVINHADTVELTTSISKIIISAISQNTGLVRKSASR